MTAIEQFGATIVGYANEDLNPTQVYNCHKLMHSYLAGYPIQLSTAIEDPTHIRHSIAKALSVTSIESKDRTALRDLLVTEQRPLEYNLNRFLDYVTKNGTDHFKPVASGPS